MRQCSICVRVCRMCMMCMGYRTHAHTHTAIGVDACCSCSCMLWICQNAILNSTIHFRLVHSAARICQYGVNEPLECKDVDSNGIKHLFYMLRCGHGTIFRISATSRASRTLLWYLNWAPNMRRVNWNLSNSNVMKKKMSWRTRWIDSKINTTMCLNFFLFNFKNFYFIFNQIRWIKTVLFIFLPMKCIYFFAAETFGARLRTFTIFCSSIKNARTMRSRTHWWHNTPPYVRATVFWRFDMRERSLGRDGRMPLSFSLHWPHFGTFLRFLTYW